jgi:hypothetical protein
LGTRDSVGARARDSKRMDVNEDGIEDLLLKFKISETGLTEAEDNTVVLTGGFVGGSEVFKSYDTIANVGSPIDQCYTVAGANATGIRCEFTESLVPLDLKSLVSEINQAIADEGVTITDDSAVVVEAYGGKGHDGNSLRGRVNVDAGLGGARGYASTLLTLG